MSGALDDVRHGVRALRRAPGFCALALATLALGIGVTSAMFSVVYGVLLRPLPFHEPGRVVRVWRTAPTGNRGNFAPAPYLDVVREARSLAGTAAYFASPAGLASTGQPTRTPAAEVTTNFFDVLGASAALGRTFSAATDHPGTRLVVLGDGAWRTAFGADPGIVGRTVRVDGQPYTVVGVMAPGFAYPDDVRLWRLPARDVPAAPLQIDGDLLAQRDVGFLDVVARLRDGVTEREAAADLRVLAASLAARHPTSDAGEGFDVSGVQEAEVGDARRSLLVLFGAVGAVLLIACTNLASLLLARALGRRREFAVRAALGAARLRLVRQLLIENLVLALTGGALGLLVSAWSLDALVSLLPSTVPRTADIHLDGAVVLFAFGVAVLSGLAIGTVPAWLSAGDASAAALRDGGRGASAGRQGIRRVLVGAQVALAVVLLTGAGVMLKSLFNLQHVDVGFRADGVVTQQIVLPQSQFDSVAQRRFYQGVVDHLQADPRIRAASVVFPTPLVNNQAGATLRLDRAKPGDPPDRKYRVRLGSIGSEYFATLGVPFVAGRDFLPTDFAETARGVIVNRALVRQLLGDGDALARGLRFGDTDEDMYRVIGVVADVVAVSLDQAAEPTAYLPFTHLTLPFMRLVASGAGPESATRQAIAAAVRVEAADLPLDPPEPLGDVVTSASAEPRFRARLSAAFSLAALALAALGVYGLVNYLVASRTRDIATRLALGATPDSMWRRVIGEGLLLTLGGVAAGAAAVGALGRVVDGLLFGTRMADPAILGGLAGLMLAVAVVACYLPARRAMRVDPMTALRAE